MRSATPDPIREGGFSDSSTVDIFHRGRFALVQPAQGGHRAGTDAMMLAAAVPQDFAGRLADLGAGAGAAGLAVASRGKMAEVVLVERSPLMADYARRSLGLEENRELAERTSVLEADVTLAGRARIEAGLGDRSFDFVIMNPPFNDATHRPAPDPLKREAHAMDDGLLEGWLRSAAAILKPGGSVAVILRPTSLGELLLAMKARFGGIEIRPVHPRPVADATRLVVRARRGSRAGIALKPALVLHHEEGHGFTAEADAVTNGQAPLFPL